MEISIKSEKHRYGEITYRYTGIRITSKRVRKIPDATQNKVMAPASGGSRAFSHRASRTIFSVWLPDCTAWEIIRKCYRCALIEFLEFMIFSEKAQGQHIVRSEYVGPRRSPDGHPDG